MRWKGRRQSANVEDRRGRAPKAIAGGGIGTIVIILLITYFTGGDPTDVLQNSQLGVPAATGQYEASTEENEPAQFVSVVLAETEDVWTALFSDMGYRYEMPKLVLYSGQVQSACGMSGAATGPFYCPGDRKVYIDLSFFDDLQTRFHAPGDFAMAYVVAHEVGHHVQTLLGISQKVQSLRSQLSETEFNRYLVRLELQADFFAGVWAHYAQRAKLLEPGDLEEALNAASAVGDDRIQKSSRGYVVPDSFTHGTSAQRRRWFQKGFRTGDPNQGDTFNADVL